MRYTNIRMLSILTTVSFLAMLTLSGAAFAAPVTVIVSVKTAGGAPIADAPIEVGSDTEADFGFTDESGIVTFTIELSPEDPDIIARLWDGRYHNDLTVDEILLADQQYTTLPEIYNFKPRYLVQTAPGQIEYQIDIVAHPSIQATGRLVDTQGVPLQDNYFAIGVRDSAWFGEFLNAEGVFAAHGIRQGTSAELGLVMKGPETHLIQLSAVQTMQNIELGDIVVQQHERPVPLTMSVINTEGLRDSAGVALWREVSLIRSDAQVLLTFPIKPPDGEVVAEVVKIQTDVPRTTEGVYYVVPGPIAAPTAFALLDAIRIGDHGVLDAAGVPKFTAVAGQTTEFTLDARQARDAIRAATDGAP